MVLCAAIKYKDIVIPCWRHGFGYSILHDLGHNASITEVEEGFITTDNVFLNRAEALRYACKCHQLPSSVLEYKSEHFESELYSEDLY